MTDELYSLKEVLRRYPVSRTEWYRGMKAGRYPAGHRRRGRRFWRPQEISRLIRRGEGA